MSLKHKKATKEESATRNCVTRQKVRPFESASALKIVSTN
jgi:hypothetical protein